MASELLNPHGGAMAIAMFLLIMPWLLLNAVIGSTQRGCRRYVRMLRHAVTCLGGIAIIGCPLTVDAEQDWLLRLIASGVLVAWACACSFQEIVSAQPLHRQYNTWRLFVVLLSQMMMVATCIASAIVFAWRFPAVGLIIGVYWLLWYALLVVLSATLLYKRP